jgi:sugar/nucleoside kinase (ribokinase family)
VLDSAAASSELPSAEVLAGALAASLDAAVVVTDGPAGAAVATVNGAARVSGAAAPEVDATGAGDAHAAAVVLGLAGGPWPPSVDELRQAVAAAARAGAEVAGVVGAQARIPSEG